MIEIAKNMKATRALKNAAQITISKRTSRNLEASLKVTGSVKKALLTAASVTAAIGLGSAIADEGGVFVAENTVQEQTVISAPASPSVPEVASPLETSVRPSGAWFWAALAVGGLAGFVRLIGANRVINAVSDAAPQIGKAATDTIRVPLKAVKSIGEAVGSSFIGPLRFALILGGLGLAGMTGVGFYDVEWLGGLAVGAAMVATTWYGALKVRQKVPARRRS